jgi:hypothetical protein
MGPRLQRYDICGRHCREGWVCNLKCVRSFSDEHSSGSLTWHADACERTAAMKQSRCYQWGRALIAKSRSLVLSCLLSSRWVSLLRCRQVTCVRPKHSLFLSHCCLYAAQYLRTCCIDRSKTITHQPLQPCFAGKHLPSGSIVY